VAVLVILILLALISGVGAVVKGILWVLAIPAALVIAAVYAGYRKLKGSG
jgi:4-hydroxybenzoate polyprenyltransferase